MKRIPQRWLLPLSLVAALVAAATVYAGAAEPLPEDVFAMVNGHAIPGSQYLTVLRSQARQRFYHGKAPETALATFRREVGEDLILRALVAQEAERRGIEADESEVATQVAALEQRYSRQTDWERRKERFLREVTAVMRTNGRIDRLEAQVRDLPPPTEEQLQAYYRGHPDQFTTPERMHVSTILRRVPPSASDDRWRQAREEVEALAGQLAQGASFGALARQHSQDPTADDDGDMGYLHRNMLGDTAQAAIDALAVGGTTTPLRLLEGYALFRLHRREPARLNALSDVRERAAGLWLRQARDEAWRAFGAGLRRQATVRVNERYYAIQAQEVSDAGGRRAVRP